jgi:hypothetical protein
VGEKIKSAAIWLRDRVVDAAKWARNAPATQWAVSKIQWAWTIAKGPVIAAGVGLGTIAFVPKLIAIVPLALIGVGGYLIWKAFSQEKATSAADSSELNELVNAGETMGDRFADLDQRLVAASDKKDAGLVSEITGRMYLLKVRAGEHEKLKKDATVSVIHRECRKENEDQAISNITGFKWDWKRMYDAIQREDTRLKDLAKAKVEQSKKPVLTGV